MKVFSNKAFEKTQFKVNNIKQRERCRAKSKDYIANRKLKTVEETRSNQVKGKICIQVLDSER
jgi:hypothetical protein